TVLPWVTRRPQSAFVKEELVLAKKIWPGQRLTLYVKLYTTTSFSGSTRFELPKVSGILIMENEDRPLIGTEKIDALPYIFKRHEIVLFPLRPGNLTLPAFNVEFGFRGENGKEMKQNFTTQPFKFSVLNIPGATPQKPVITSNNLQVKDRWVPEPSKAKVGDALTRTILMTADDLPGMAFPPLGLKKIDGLGFYTKPAQVDDQRQRGQFTGSRTETITYICEQEGTFKVPGISIQWWNPKTENLKEVPLKAVKITVSANLLLEKESPAGATIGTGSTGFPWKVAVIILLFSVVTGILFFRFRGKMLPHKTKTADPEKELFTKFQTAAASNDAAATMQALLCWLDQSKFAGNPGSLELFSTLTEDSELKKEIEYLEKTLYASTFEKQWSGEQLFGAVQRARKNLMREMPQTKRCGLPELNP
ncbi:MAG TPA: hypothetical protein EYP64_08900, partial [Desulfarculaceae bacterium]|nr:hypothetical protein [Desulfarculaceae bacterium]